MSDYTISTIPPSDRRSQAQIDALLLKEGIRRDANLDVTVGMQDEDYNIIATGSCFGNTLRCMAVDSSHQGEGLMNEIVSHLVDLQFSRGNYHLFLYTKCDSAKFFQSLGFYEIARIKDELVFMENKRTGFSDYLKRLAGEGQAEAQPQTASGESSVSPSCRRVASLVMNANPFTLGHQYLVEKAAAENDVVHLFMVSEDKSLFPFAVRRDLILKGTAHLPNVICHESGPYIISSATFPSYFQKDESSVIRGHALLDLTIFGEIAKVLGIQRRYVGEEPSSLVTGIYNQIMSEELPGHGLECIIVPRKEFSAGTADPAALMPTSTSAASAPISASTVRCCLKEGDWDSLALLVPETTLSWLKSAAAEPVLQKIRMTAEVKHY